MTERWIVCPHCKYDDTDTDINEKDGYTIVICSQCKKKFLCSVQISHTYFMEKIEYQLNAELNHFIKNLTNLESENLDTLVKELTLRHFIFVKQLTKDILFFEKYKIQIRIFYKDNKWHYCLLDKENE